MKKTICVLLSLLLAFSVSMPAFAALETDDLTEYPVIIVPGYSSSGLCYYDENGERGHVWGIDMDVVKDLILGSIAEVVSGVCMLGLGKAEYLTTTVGNGMVEMLDTMRCNPDGSSIYNVQPYLMTAEETNSAVLFEEYPNGANQFETEIMGEVADYIGYDKIYNFTCDFRTSAVDCAKRLDSYIEDVLKYSGADKVNIIAVSHGGQVTATYLSLFGFKRQVDNAVLTVPAIGGAGIAYDMTKSIFDFDEETLIRFVEHGMMEETDYNWLVKAQQLGILDDILAGLQPYLMTVAGYWGSIWDFIPTEYYEDTKQELLDPTESMQLIAKSDYMHYEVMPNIGAGLKKCNDEYGMNVSIIAGYGNPVVTGLKVQSDGIITTAASTGATVAPFGQRFSDGYTAICGNNEYVSPDMCVDASTAYLPDNTWFVDGLFHGMTYKDDYTIELMMKLMLTDDITDVHTNPRFPRFHATTNVSSSVFFAFDSSTQGYLGDGDSKLVITNLSRKNEMTILAVNVNGADFKISATGLKAIAPGESATADISGTIPAVSKTCVDVTVTYMLTGSPTPINERTLTFTINNGEAPEYDAENPYTDAGQTSVDRAADGYTAWLLDGLGLKQVAAILLNVINYLIANFKNIFAGLFA